MFLGCKKAMKKRAVFSPQKFIPRAADQSWRRYLKNSIDPSGFVIKDVDENVGKGVFTKKKIPNGSFILEYSGELINYDEAIKREETYPESYGSYLLFFQVGKTSWCIDATFSTTHGRYVNDATGEARNAFPKVVIVEGKPHVAFFAIRNIRENEEIRFDYGVSNLPWRKIDHQRQTRNKVNYRHKHDIKECFVLLEKLDLSSDRIPYEKYDGTSTWLTCNGLAVNKDQKRRYDQTAMEFHDESTGNNDDETDMIALSNDEVTQFTATALMESPVQSTSTNENDITMFVNANLELQEFTAQQKMTSQNMCTGFNGDEINMDTQTHGELLELPEQTSMEFHGKGTDRNEDETAMAALSNDEVTQFTATALMESPVQSTSTNENDITMFVNANLELQEFTEQTFMEFHGKGTDHNDDETAMIALSNCDVTQFTATALMESPVQSTSTNENDITMFVNANSEVQELTGSSKAKSKRKPHRPCPYCKCDKSALTKHLSSKHKDEAEVKHALSLPKQERHRAFLLLKRKGIMSKNMEILRGTSDDCNNDRLIIERKKTCESLKSDIIYCSKCFGFFSKEYFHRHRRICHSFENSSYLPVAISPQKPASVNTNNPIFEAFNSEILGSFHDDQIGAICRSDSIIKEYGLRKFNRLQNRKQISHYDEKKTVLRSEMRRLGLLYKEFKIICNENKIKPISVADMLKRDYYSILEESIEKITTNDDGSIKPGARKDFGYLIKRLCKYLHGVYSVQKEDNKVNELNKFLDVLNHYWADLIGDAEFAIAHKRQTVLRKPIHLPQEDDVKRLRSYMLLKLKQLTDDEFVFVSKEEFKLLRDVVVSRLTLFNARRGGEPSRMTEEQWDDAKKGRWIGDSVNIDDPLERSLLGKFKVTYQTGKGGKLVPILILEDCWTALDILCDNTIRKNIGIHPENKYVFPLMQYSTKHVSGWKSVNDCCSLAQLGKSITATNMRHYMATIYAGLEIPEAEREAFYSHMGHSASINKNVYQSPLARQEITKVGKFLEEVDKGHHCLPQTEQHEERDDEPFNMETGGISVYETDHEQTTAQPLKLIKHDDIHIVQLDQKSNSRISMPAVCHLRDENYYGNNATKELEKSDGNNTTEGLEKSDGINVTKEQKKGDGNKDIEKSNESNASKDLGKSNENDAIKETEKDDGNNATNDLEKSDGNNATQEQKKSIGNNATNDLEESDGNNAKKEQKNSDGNNATKETGGNDGNNASKEQKKQRRQYCPWQMQDTLLIKEYFRKYIFSSDSIDGNKGPLPNMHEIRTFLTENPTLDVSLTMRDRIHRVRTKIFNERKLAREGLKRSAGSTNSRPNKHFEYKKKCMSEDKEIVKPTFTQDINDSEDNSHAKTFTEKFENTSVRKYNRWHEEDTILIKQYFKKYLYSSSMDPESNKGPLPNVQELNRFLSENPAIDANLTIQDRIKRLRSKIFNERKLARESFRRK